MQGTCGKCTAPKISWSSVTCPSCPRPICRHCRSNVSNAHPASQPLCHWLVLPCSRAISILCIYATDTISRSVEESWSFITLRSTGRRCAETVANASSPAVRVEQLSNSSRRVQLCRQVFIYRLLFILGTCEAS